MPSSLVDWGVISPLQAWVQSGHKLISKDEYVRIMNLWNHFDSFLTEFTVVPEVTVSFGHPELMKEACALLSLSSEDGSLPQLISYDSTFKLGDFYLSPILMRNIKLKGNPAFPFAFFLHKEKKSSHHKYFLANIAEKLGEEHMKNVPFLTERKKVIWQHFSNNIPHIQEVYNWNRILNDVSTWIKRHRRTKNRSILKDHVALLLNSASEEEYQQNYEQCSPQWSRPFKNYFDRELKDVIPNHAARFFIQRFSAFKNDITATNNNCEIMTRVITKESGRKKIPVDCLVHSMYNLQIFLLYEFQRAYGGLENYALKEQFSYLRQTEESQFPSHCPPEAVVDSIKSDFSG